MPSRCRGRSSGSSSTTQPTIRSRFSFSIAPPMPYPSRSRRDEVARGTASQVLVLRALDDAEQQLGRPETPVLGDAALGPRLGAGDRLLLVLAGVHQRGQLVEGEDHVGAELVLDLHRHLGREPVRRPVEVAPERDTLVVDDGQPVLAWRDDVVGRDAGGVHGERLLEAGAQAQHLEPAGVGERRPGPVHEAAETTGLLDDVGARLQVQVVGVRQQGLGAELTHRLREHRLDGGLRPDRDESGSADVTVRRWRGRRCGRALTPDDVRR